MLGSAAGQRLEKQVRDVLLEKESNSPLAEHVGGHASVFDADAAGQKRDLRQLHLL